METIRNHWMQWNIRAFTYFHDESHFHNDMIQIAVERGLLRAGGVAMVRYRLCRLPASTGLSCAPGIAALPPASPRVCWPSFVALQLTSIVHYNLGIESVAMILFFYFGLAVAIDRMLQRSERDRCAVGARLEECQSFQTASGAREASTGRSLVDSRCPALAFRSAVLVVHPHAIAHLR